MLNSIGESRRVARPGLKSARNARDPEIWRPWRCAGIDKQRKGLSSIVISGIDGKGIPEKSGQPTCGQSDNCKAPLAIQWIAEWQHEPFEVKPIRFALI